MYDNIIIAYKTGTEQTVNLVFKTECIYRTKPNNHVFLTFVLKPFNIKNANCIILAKKDILNMKIFCIFDIIGHIMVCPSSSHIVGVARLGKIAKIIVGTDRALVAGLAVTKTGIALKDKVFLKK